MKKELFEVISLDDESVLYFSDKIEELNFSNKDFEKIWDTHPEEFHTVKMYGKEILTPRWQQAYGKNYSYSGSKNNALPIPELFKIFLEWSQKNVDARLNGLLLNWYDGQKDHYIGPHRDDTRDLIHNTPIVTISLGQERIFRMRKYGEKGFKDITIRNSGIIIIPWNTNLKWTHEVPKFKKYDGKRISVTLRAYQ
ncbi:alpha-ketoglutarate-dependent dioxygenase AlkB [Kordia sp.]|uniref:alpha-ketoglutarate-dependent dioxygenase AlkB n=1 Tax=Kordia sp. TaxID=1965332 RepID=UPI003B5A809C